MASILAPLKLPADAAAQTFLIVGKRGSGKSNTAACLAEGFFAAGIPFLVIDPVDNWWGLKASASGTAAGLGVYVFGGRHADLPLEATAGALIADAVMAHRISAVLSVKHLSGAERGRFVAELAQRLFQKNERPLHVFLEEAHEVAPQQPFKGEEAMVGAVTRLWKLGRSSGIGGSAITQRPASLSKNITTQAEILVVHRTIGPQDVAAVREWIRYHGQEEKILKELATLKTGEAFVWAPDWPEEAPIGLQRVTLARRTTFDSAATPKMGEARREPSRLAPVDLDRLRAQMAATIERARAEDPRVLRARIQDLERAVAAGAAARPRPAAAAREIEAAKVARRAAAALRTGVIGIRRQTDALQERLLGQVDRLAAVHKDALGILDALDRALDAPLPAAGEDPEPPASPAVALRFIGTGPGDPAVGRGGMRRILTALAQRPQGLQAGQIALRAGMAQSGTFDTYMSRARKAGWIEGTGTIRLTGAGIAALGAYTPLPIGRALGAYWLARFGGGMHRLLQAAIQAYPAALTAARLAEKAEMAQSGTFDTYVSRLRKLDLIEGTGEIRASGELFEEGER